jgi:hypothetical protein
MGQKITAHKVKQIDQRVWMVSFSTELEQVAGSCEHGSDYSGSIRIRKITD